MMNRQELFKKYNIDTSHNVWAPHIDNWMSVEIYRFMHDGNLPPEDDESSKYITDFLDYVKTDEGFVKIHKVKQWGSLFLTAKRMVFKFADEILKECI